MRIFWDTLETADRLTFQLLDRLDRARGLPSLFDRTQARTAHVRPPQRVIEFDK